jgi:uncharacterized coiled-coil protein SlyX
VTNPAEFEARLAALETDVALHRTVDAAASDAAAARRLAAARDSDLADLTIKVDANRGRRSTRWACRPPPGSPRCARNSTRPRPAWPRSSSCSPAATTSSRWHTRPRLRDPRRRSIVARVIRDVAQLREHGQVECRVDELDVDVVT